MVARLVPAEDVRSIGRTPYSAPDLGGGDFSQKHLLFSHAHKFWRHKWIIVLTVLLGLLYGTYEAINQTPQYRATLSMLIDPEDTISEARVGTQNFYTWKSTATQGALIQSRSVAEEVVDRLDLVHRNPLLDIPERTYQIGLLRWIKSKLTAVMPSIGETEPVAQAPQPAVASEGRRDQLAQMVRGGLSVRGDKETELIFLNFTSPDPKFASEIVNAVASTFVKQREQVQLERAQRATKLLTEQLPELKVRLANATKALQEYRLKESVSDTQHFKEISNTRIQSLTAEATSKRLELEELSKSYGPKHPKIIAAKAQMLQTERYLARESEKILGSRQKEFKLGELEQEVRTSQELYETSLLQLRELNISANQAIKDARIIDNAKIPQAPFAPNESKIIGNRMLIAAMWGIGIILLIIFLDNTFRDTEQIEELLGIPCLGALPLLSKADLKTRRGVKKGNKGAQLKPELYILGQPKSVFTESVNHIRTGVIYSDPDNPPQVVVVSSAVENEGKTTLATNLAIAFSQFGDTLLIDADLRNPGVKKLTNQHHMSGLVDLIIGKATKAECISKDKGNPRFYVLNHGLIPPNPLELLSSERFKHVLDDLKKTFKHIIIDTPPILPVSDAIVLAHIAGGLIVTVEANKTKFWTTRQAIKRLIKANVQPLGIVLSKLDIRKSYYPSYGSYYSSYYYNKKA